MRKILFVFLSLFVICLVAAHLDYAEAVEKQPFRHVLALGATKPVSNAEENRMSPIILYNWYMEDLPNNLYGQLGLVTTRVFYIFGYKTDSVFAGVTPQLNHTTYGAFHAYDDRGRLDQSRVFKGNNAGIELFCQYKIIREIAARVSYYPGYHFYAKYEEEEGFPFDTEETTIELPNDHWEHTGAFDLSFNNVVATDINRVKHGVMLSAKYLYTRRAGYGTFEDTGAAPSDIDGTHRRYAALGIYYKFPYDINLQLDAYGGWHKNVDRNNSDQIGSFASTTAPMIGYFYGEFYHHRYGIARAQLGFPLLPWWGTRIQPGFNVLYMARENDVVGVGNYPRRVYRSYSAALSTKLGNVLPVFVTYAYGMDARRVNDSDGTSEKGNHEIIVVALMAFGAR